MRDWGDVARKFLNLPLRVKASYFRLVWLTAFVEVALRVLPVGRALRVLRIRTKWTEHDPVDGFDPVLSIDDLEEVRRVKKLMRHWPFAEGVCLRQALVLAVLLRRYHPLLCLGASKVDGRIYAHAWIEVVGGTLGYQEGFIPFRFTQPDGLTGQHDSNGRTA